jgi:hypothetical protein
VAESCGAHGRRAPCATCAAAWRLAQLAEELGCRELEAAVAVLEAHLEAAEDLRASLDVLARTLLAWYRRSRPEVFRVEIALTEAAAW